jgi:Nif-specific regulatory protein
MACLILRQSGSEDKIYNLTKSVVTIGRSLSNDVPLQDPFVSRVHAKIRVLEDGSCEIQDVGAKHPIKVNEEAVSRHRLKDGDQIKLGYSVLFFRSGDAPLEPDVKLLSNEDMSQETMEIASFDAKKTLPFSDREVEAKDFISLQNDHQRLMLLYEFSKAANSHLEDSRYILDEIMKTVFKILDAERGFIALVDENTQELTYELVQDKSQTQPQEKLEVSRTIVHKVLREGVSLLTINALKDSNLGKAKSIQEYNIRSALCAPLLFREAVLGIIYLDNRVSEGSFSPDDLMFLQAMCHQAGIALGNAHLHRQIVQENIRLENALKPKFQILGESEGMKKIYTTIKKIAPTDVTVLIQGETGTGKELVAKVLHELSRRREKPFIAVNCAAIPKELIESELFGHEKGAFTGATSVRQGKFQMAHGGTLFLDEVGDMSLDTQAKVLRTLEERELQPIGGTRTVEVDVRVVAATNMDLRKAVERGTFREDLYFRLNVVPLELPPLRARKEDILPLAEYFAAGRIKKISAQAQRLLLSYQWPGNVRELKNCIERAVVMGDGEMVQPEDLPHYVRGGRQTIPEPLDSLKRFEAAHITRVLRSTGWRKSEAAKMLGISRQTLDNKIKAHKIKR